MNIMRETALHSNMKKQIDYSNSPEVVSSDFVGSRAACVFDAKATIVNGKQAVLYLWYDNEYGYSCQVYRVLERMAGISLPNLPCKRALTRVADLTSCGTGWPWSGQVE